MVRQLTVAVLLYVVEVPCAFKTLKFGRHETSIVDEYRQERVVDAPSISAVCMHGAGWSCRCLRRNLHWRCLQFHDLVS